MTDEQTKQAILGFTEFFKGITGNQNLEIPSEIAGKCGIQAQADGEKSFKMRDATPEERELIDKYIKSISKPTGVDFWDLEQEPCEDANANQHNSNALNDVGQHINALEVDAISRKALISHIENQSREWGEDYDAQQILGDIEDMPSVKPQESNITWVTGADGAKIAFWDVPVWKVTKICEILGVPQERSDNVT